MTNHIDDSVLAQWFSSSAEFSAPLDTEMKTEFYLRSAIEKIKPSNIYALAKLSNDQDHFADLMAQASLASVMPSEAEEIASCVVDSFDLNKQAEKADAAWLLMLLIAAQSACPDTEWSEARSVCKRVLDATTPAKTDLLSALLGDLGTQPVFMGEIDKERGAA